jgi:hypothetical protein
MISMGGPLCGICTRSCDVLYPNMMSFLPSKVNMTQAKNVSLHSAGDGCFNTIFFVILGFPTKLVSSELEFQQEFRSQLV